MSESNNLPDEKSLVRRAAGGDRDAMLQLLLDHQQQLGRFVAKKISQQPHSDFSADDIIQETAFKAFQNAESLKAEHEGAFYSWLKTIAQNLIADIVRRERTAKRGGGRINVANQRATLDEGRATELIEQLSGEGFSPSYFAARDEAIVAIQVAVNALPDDQRRAIQLHCFDQQTLDATAKSMDRTPTAVHGLIQRAKRNLRGMMHHSSMWLSRKR